MHYYYFHNPKSSYAYVTLEWFERFLIGLVVLAEVVD